MKNTQRPNLENLLHNFSEFCKKFHPYFRTRQHQQENTASRHRQQLSKPQVTSYSLLVDRVEDIHRHLFCDKWSEQRGYYILENNLISHYSQTTLKVYKNLLHPMSPSIAQTTFQSRNAECRKNNQYAVLQMWLVGKL